MYDRILFPTDGSDAANAALDHALDLAANRGATLYILNVADTARDSVTLIDGDVIDVLERDGEKIVEAAAERAAQRGVSTVTDVHQGRVPETIVSYVEEFDIDLVAMPTQGRTGVEQILLGSVTDRLVRTSPVPVLTIPVDSSAT